MIRSPASCRLSESAGLRSQASLASVLRTLTDLRAYGDQEGMSVCRIHAPIVAARGVECSVTSWQRRQQREQRSRKQEPGVRAGVLGAANESTVLRAVDPGHVNAVLTRLCTATGDPGEQVPVALDDTAMRADASGLAG